MSGSVVTVSFDLWPSRKSEICASVVDVYVRPGDAVSEGDILLEVEVDKAVIQVESHVSGVVEKVYVSKSAKVRPGDPLVDIRVLG